MNKIQHAFDRAAKTYDDHSHPQQHAGRKLAQLIKVHHPYANRLIDLGCGTGITTEFLAGFYQYQDFHAIDISTALLTKAQQRSATSSIDFYQMNFDHLPAMDFSFDIIYSNMALQWSENLPALLQKMKNFLQDQGTFGFSIPMAGTFRELKSYCAMNYFHEADIIHQHLAQYGYEILTQEKDTLTLQFPDTLQALKSIKQIGANHVMQRMHKGLRAQSYFNQINMHELTYVIGYFVVRKK